jgi:hypothetical protein
MKLRAERLSKPARQLRIIVCADDQNNGMTCGLRGYNLARGLEDLGWRCLVIPKQLELASVAALSAPNRLPSSIFNKLATRQTGQISIPA